MIASLPMYDWPELRQSTDKFWALIAENLRKSGIEAPDRLTREPPNVAHWLRDDLVLSQTCGYPFSTDLIGKVQLVGTPHYDVEGCDGGTYSSAIVVRKDADYGEIGDTAGAKLAFNGLDSLSGFRCLGPLVGKPMDWFGKSIISGGHRNSAHMVARGDADIAAIDAVCWNYFQRFEPDAAKNLRVLAWGPCFPALPFVTSGKFSGAELVTIRVALLESIQLIDVSYGDVHLKLKRVSRAKEKIYSQLAELLGVRLKSATCTLI